MSNSGAFCYLFYYGISGSWAAWGVVVQVIGWASLVATFLVTLGLVVFGVRGQGEAV